MTDSLIKSWNVYVTGERSSLSIDSAQKDGRIKSLTGTLWSGARISRKRKGISISSEAVVQVHVYYTCNNDISMLLNTHNVHLHVLST